MKDLLAFVAYHHEGQVRAGGETYFEHVYRVSKKVARYGFLYEDIGLLHDILEECDISADELREYLQKGYSSRYANYIVQNVIALTPEYTSQKYPDINRSGRQALERTRLATPRRYILDTYNHAVHTVKVSDVIDNLSTVENLDPKFATIYLKEKKELLQVLTSADSNLLKEAINLLNNL